MICCYNAARNDPYKESQHPRYTPLNKLPDSEILKAGKKRFADTVGDAAWIDPAMGLTGDTVRKEDRSY